MNGKVTDAAIQQWAEKHGLTSRTIRGAYEEAARQLAKPDAVRLRDEPPERAVVEKRIVADRPEGMSSDYVYGWNDCVDALAATGKQQVGEVQGDGLPIRTVYAIATSWREQASSLKVGRATLIRCAAELEASLAARQPVGQEPVADECSCENGGVRYAGGGACCATCGKRPSWYMGVAEFESRSGASRGSILVIPPLSRRNVPGTWTIPSSTDGTAK